MDLLPHKKSGWIRVLVNELGETCPLIFEKMSCPLNYNGIGRNHYPPHAFVSVTGLTWDTLASFWTIPMDSDFDHFQFGFQRLWNGALAHARVGDRPEPGTVVHHALQDWGLICFTIAEYWAKSIVQSLLGIIGDLAFFLINSVTVRGFTIKAWLWLSNIGDGLRYPFLAAVPYKRLIK